MTPALRGILLMVAAVGLFVTMDSIAKYLSRWYPAPTWEGLSSPARCERLAVAKRDEEGVEVSAGPCGSNKASRGVKFSSCIDLVEGA